MNREEIFIKENFKLDDSHSKVRGFVFAYDENDNLVFAKENMIVKSGRKYIMEYGIGSGFKCAFLSSNNEMVTERDTITSIKKSSDGKNIDFPLHMTAKNNEKNFSNIDSVDVTQYSEDDYFDYKIDNINLEIQCLIVFNSTKLIEANSLGLIVEDPKSRENILFSRVTFPTYYKSASQRLTFKYYIYF